MAHFWYEGSAEVSTFSTGKQHWNKEDEVSWDTGRRFVSHTEETRRDRATEDALVSSFFSLFFAPLRRCNRPRLTAERPPQQHVRRCCDGHLTWGSLALSDQEGALRIPGREEEPHGFVSRNVLEEPPAVQTHIVLHAYELTTSPPSGARHALCEMVLWLSNIVAFPVRWRTVRSPPWSLQQSCTGWSPAGLWSETRPNTTLDRPWMWKERAPRQKALSLSPKRHNNKYKVCSIKVKFRFCVYLMWDYACAPHLLTVHLGLGM